MYNIMFLLSGTFLLTAENMLIHSPHKEEGDCAYILCSNIRRRTHTISPVVDNNEEGTARTHFHYSIMHISSNNHLTDGWIHPAGTTHD